MAKKDKISFPTKLLSNRHYLNEVPVEGKTTPKFHYTIGYYDLYAAQVIRSGNCITLLSNELSITEDSFWNANHFEDLAKYIFWTFNQGFLHNLQEAIQTQKLSILRHCCKLLTENFIPYGDPIPENADEELKWCYVKKGHLKNDPKFNRMFSLDQENRKTFLLAVEKRIAEFPHPSPVESKQATSADIPSLSTVPTPQTILFLETLVPLEGGAEVTLQFIIDKLGEAGFDFKIFSLVPRLPNGKNPYGLNGCIAAMIDFFYQHRYFKKEYSLEEIFKAFLQYSGNSIGKLHTFLSEFRDDKSYHKHFGKLKALKINKLS